MTYPKEAYYTATYNGKEICIKTVVISETINHYQEENGSEFLKTQLLKFICFNRNEIKDVRNWYGNIIE